MNIAMYPYINENNKYISLMKESIEKKNKNNIVDFNEVIKDKKKLKNTEYFIFNWYESLYADSLYMQTKLFIKKYIILNILRINNKKIIWVVHNKVPHDDRIKIFSKCLMRWLAKNSYKIIIHSYESKYILNEIIEEKKINKKTVYIPHPNYIGVYKEKQQELSRNGTLNLLFIGVIKEYKNVDLLINVFNELNLKDVTLTLAGKVSNKYYEKYINELIDNNRNIKTDFRFIDDNEISQLINKSDILVLPYDIKSSLNSGTILLAFSNKKTVLSPLIGTLKDFKNKDMFFSYTYIDINSHKKELKKKLLAIYELHRQDKSILKKMGKECYLNIKNKNSLHRISEIFEKEIF